MSWLILAAFVLVIIYCFLRYQQSYWARRGVTGPPPSFFFGNSLSLMDQQRPGTLQLQKWTKEYGKAYGINEGSRKVLVISDPDMVHELFVEKFDNFYARKNMPLQPDAENHPRVHVFAAQGKRWKRLRAISNPTFTVNNLKKIRFLVEDTASNMIALLDKEANKSINIHEYFQEYTFDIIGRLVMGQQGSNLFNNPLITPVKKMFSMDLNKPHQHLGMAFPPFRSYIREAFFLFKHFMKLPFLEVLEAMEKAVNDRIALRESLKAAGEWDSDSYEPRDFIDLFLDARSDDSVFLNEKDGYSKHESIKVEKTLSRDEVVAQCIVFVLAGFDTTANSLAYASFLLAKHPDIMRRVQAEIDEHCSGQVVSYESLSQLKYTDQVMKEALRMYPLAAFAQARTCISPTTLGGIPVEKGVFVQADVFSLHYNKEIWGDDADKFNPSRFESTEKRHPAAWIPFGSGPRVCIGMRLAYMEEKMAFVHILRKFDIVEAPDSEKELKLTGSMTISPEKVTVRLVPRKL